jgi:hypothetical protein
MGFWGEVLAKIISCMIVQQDQYTVISWYSFFGQDVVGLVQHEKYNESKRHGLPKAVNSENDNHT